MASWCEREGYEYSADFLYGQSDDERDHMMRIFRYINAVGGRAVTPPTEEVPQDFDTFRGVFEMVLEQEVKVSRSINHLVDKCYKAKDHTTMSFLQWFLEEQKEEEAVARRCLELFDVIGEEGIGRYTIDKEIGDVKPKPGAEPESKA